MQTLGYRLQASFITGYAGKTAPPFERFFQGGDTDLRGFDIRSASPTALIADQVKVTLTNPDGSVVPGDQNNPRVGPYTITVPITRLVYPGGDTSLVGNLEYRIPIVGPVTIAIFDDMGMNMAVRQSQLRLSDQQFDQLDVTPFGCPTAVAQPNGTVTCQGTQSLQFSQNIVPLAHTNYVLRMSTGLELQVILPVVNAPFRLYYAYNPLRVDTDAPQPTLTRDMFPAGGAGEYTYLNTIATYAPSYLIREPRKTLRFTVATTF
jgi:outer membrane protein insertion porin family